MDQGSSTAKKNRSSVPGVVPFDYGIPYPASPPSPLIRSLYGAQGNSLRRQTRNQAMLSRSECNSNAVSVPVRAARSQGERSLLIAPILEHERTEMEKSCRGGRCRACPRCFWARVTWPFHLRSCPRHVHDRVPADDRRIGARNA